VGGAVVLSGHVVSAHCPGVSPSGRRLCYYTLMVLTDYSLQAWCFDLTNRLWWTRAAFRPTCVCIVHSYGTT